MTNEQLATFISQGGNDELIPLLWDKVRKLVYRKADSFYKLHVASCKQHGVEVWDIRQAAYIAFLDALKGFKPESDLKFVSFISFPLQNAVRDLLGIRTEKGRNEPLNNCTSLDKPVSDEDGSTTLIELQEDETSTDFIDRLESALISDIIRAEVETLNNPYYDVIRWYYFEDKKLGEIGELLSLSVERVRQIRIKAERELRKSKTLRKLYNEHYQGQYVPHRKYYDWQPGNYASIKRCDSALAADQDISEVKELLSLFTALQKG